MGTHTGPTSFLGLGLINNISMVMWCKDICAIYSCSGEGVKVFVRVRPPDPNLEGEVGQGVCLDVTSDTTLTMHSKPDLKVFTFDHVADRNTTQVRYKNNAYMVFKVLFVLFV